MVCEKCGHEISGNDLVCGYCGKSLQNSQLTEEAKHRLQEEARSDESLKPNHEFRFRGFGIFLMVVGGICDLIAMMMVTSLDVSAFSTVLTIGSIAFGLGLVFTFALRG